MPLFVGGNNLSHSTFNVSTFTSFMLSVRSGCDPVIQTVTSRASGDVWRYSVGLYSSPIHLQPGAVQPCPRPVRQSTLGRPEATHNPCWVTPRPWYDQDPNCLCRLDCRMKSASYLNSEDVPNLYNGIIAFS